MSYLREAEGGITLSVHAQPKASRTKIVGLHGEALKIAVQAPPVEGAANEALLEFLASFFGVAKRAVVLRTGETARKKVFFVAGLTAERATKLVEGQL